ncbi:MAG TPA: hypothetical protein VFN88_05065 [Caulobacteraceae bacterium]|nr:hypothetical protein [Caulobacteraceae bacterium]
MPQKHDNTERWGGPGASHENRDKPQAKDKGREARTDTEVRFSHVSGGGGERDRHHGRSDKAKRDTEENAVQKKWPGD